jgi:hypothetical protein
MTMRALPAALVATAVAVLGLLPGAALAAYDPGGAIASVDLGRLEQGDDGVIAASMTPDGRYLVFQTRASNFFADDDPDPPGVARQGGVFRFDRSTGALSLVADGDQLSATDGSVLVRGASNPSISADGRYVVFSTAQGLVPTDTNDNVDVYVRDLEAPLSGDRAASGAYRLVSARDGGDVPASYERPASAPPASDAARNPGADVWPGTAISADGRYVAFRTVEWNSDLPDRAAGATPPGQILIRDLQARRTILVTRTSRTDGATALGEPAGGAIGPYTLSSDGSTVSWTGTNAQAQARFLPGESAFTGQRYYLLRRWQEPGDARRLTGVADPTDPRCGGGAVSTDSDALGACDGPLTEIESGNQNNFLPAPALSADGSKIAYLATGSKRPLQTTENNPGLDLFYVDLASPSLKATTLELTRDGQSTDRRAVPPIDTVTITPDGRFVGITTSRDLFTLPILSPIGTFRPQPDAREAYIIDMAARTIDRVVRSSSGGDANGPVAGSVSLSADGNTVAFVSEASNLIYGDANGVADAFVATRTRPRSTAPPPAGTNRPSDSFTIGSVEGPAPKRVTVRVAHQRDGSLALSVKVPDAGSLIASAYDPIKNAKAGATKTTKRRTLVARVSGSAKKAGTTKLRLKLSSRYAAKLKPGDRRATEIVVTWSPKPPAVPVSTTVRAGFSRPKATKKTTSARKAVRRSTGVAAPSRERQVTDR